MTSNGTYIDYPLQGTKFDIPVGDLLDLDADERESFIRALLTALSKEIGQGSMALKRRVPFKQEIADYRKVLRLPIDYYLLTDSRTKKRNVLAVGAPGQTHTYRSRTHMWQMVTKQGSLAEHITTQEDALLKRLTKLFDPNRKGKEGFRKEEDLIPPTIYKFLQMNYSVGAAFPPFQARFLVSRFLPKEGKAIVVDPCAGWGGRMLGALCARREQAIRYIGVDPAKRNQSAYEELRGLYFKYLSKENKAEREADLFYAPFEKWVASKTGKSLYGKVDLVFTSPPYFDAENYEASSTRQSANAFKTYEEWREGFYIPFIQGAFELLRVGGYFILNVADTASAPHLERDARLIAKALGFSNVGYFKLAMPSAPGTKGKAKHQVTVNDAQFKFEPVFVFQKKTERGTKAANFVFPINAQSAMPKQRADGTLKTAKEYLNLIGDWSDPNQAPVIEKHKGFFIVRDDLLPYGSKMRFIDYLVRNATEKEFVLGGSNKVGWGAISLAAVCKRYGKNATFFMAATSNPTWHQNEVMRLGGRIEWIPNGRLNVTLARARAYAEAAPGRRRLLPIGLEDETVIASIIKVAQGLGVRPKEVWTVASSGTLTRGLQIAFPSAKFFAVQTGHSLTEQTAGRAEVLVSPYKYDKPVGSEDEPPYPSEPFYDAKLWTFAAQKGRKGALIWNVAGNQARIAKTD